MVEDHSDLCCERERNRIAAVYRRFVAAVIQLGDLAHESDSDDDFYHQLLELAIEVVPGAEAGSFQLTVEGTTHFRFIAAVGFDLEALQKRTLDKAYLFRDIETPKAEIIHAIGIKAKSREVVEWMEEAGRAYEIKSTLSAPVIVDGQTVAFWALDNFESFDAFDESALEMMTVMAQFVGGLFARRKLEAQLREERETLRRLATCDPLTGLPNRREFVSRLESSLVSAAAKHRASAVLYIDLDDLKQMNDSHGHDFRDKVLVGVGQRIQSALRSGDIVARWGGDEFLVLLARVDSPEEASMAGQRVIASLGEPLDLGGEVNHPVSLSVGVGWSFDSRVSADALIRVADEALYEAKSSCKGCLRLHKV